MSTPTSHSSTPRRRPWLLRLSVAAAVVWAISASSLTAAEALAAPTPVPTPSVAFSTGPEAPARYVGQVSCEPSAKPGTLALRQLLLDTYGAASIGTLRACSIGGVSEHKDGRALDWMVNAADPGDKAKADSFLAWLVGPDQDGVIGGNARRLGVMYVIWNRQTWQSWTGTWKPYTGSSPHVEHVHISLSWDGAMGRTSWWTGAAATQYDFGPCQQYVGEPAPAYTTARFSPCPPPARRAAQAFPRLWDADLSADVIATQSTGSMLLYTGSGKGDFATSRKIGTGWATMTSVTAVGDMDKDGSRDLVARDAAGRLYLYRGNGSGGFLGKVQIGRGWAGMDAILGAGDFDASGTVDLLARRASDGVVLLYPGTGAAGMGPARVVGQLGTTNLLTAVGDWDGDSYPDLVSRDSGGRLLLHSGDGTGGVRQPRRIGVGWQVMDALVGTGDFSGDGNADLLARRADGSLWLYRGDGDGGFAGASKAGRGWTSLRLSG